jgi:predicted TIM-barrel fold metal-dependent hydrolase
VPNGPAEDPQLQADNGEIRSRGLNPASWVEAGSRLVRVVSTFHHSRVDQAQRLVDEYDRVDLFTPAMVDMDGWGGEDDELLPFAARLDAMRNAALTLNRARPGVIHPFVSFNPRHGIKAYPEYIEDYHTMIESALVEQGFVGVKVYPSFGYLPLGNEQATLEEPYRVEHAAEIDRELAWLYAFAEQHGIPIMAHCTPEGAELGERHSEVYAYPKNWEPVLDRYPRLRLSLGHFGSGQGLLAGAPGQDAWPYVIAEMMERHPGLYADLSNGGITESSQLEEMLAGLDALLREHPVARERLMYGSDWFMLMLEGGSPEYFNRYDRALSAHRFGEDMRRAFFGGNAVKYLGLEQPSTRARLLAYYRAQDLSPPGWIEP